jgi:hypothetical protein
LFRYWESLPYNTKTHPYEIQTEILQFSGKSAYTSDLKGMDMHDSLDSILPYVDEWTKYTKETNTSLIRESLTKAFNNPLILADEVWTGLHNLFSGIFPTHNIECIQNFSMAYNSLIENGFTVVTSARRKLKKNECFIKVDGDDMYVLLGRSLSKDELTKLIKTHVRIAYQHGQIIEESKSEYNQSHFEFCKNQFSLSWNVKGFKRGTDHNGSDTLIPIYNTMKALNSIYHPESIPKFPKKSDLIIWFCGIMDNAYGCSQWATGVNFVVTHNRELFLPLQGIDLQISEELKTELSKDWWFRNYASLDLPNSPTYLLIKKIIKDW